MAKLKNEAKPTCRAVINHVARVYGYPLNELMGTGGNKRTQEARQIAMYLCGLRTGKSLETIARAFGGVDHTTILYAKQKIKESLASKNEFVLNVVELVTDYLKEDAMSEKAPSISDFMMPTSEKISRAASIGGSDANSLMHGKSEYIIRAWKEKCGFAVKDKKPTINMLMGKATEDLNAALYREASGDYVYDMQRVDRATHNGVPMHATLDGLCMGGEAIFEAKHTSGWMFHESRQRTMDDVVAAYMPQLHHNMHVVGVKKAVISAIFDTSKHEYRVIEFDPFYFDAMFEKEQEFWDFVQKKERPNVKKNDDEESW